MDSIVILLVALLIFGKRLPDVMRALGSSVREFKQGLADPGVTAQVASHNTAPASVAPTLPVAAPETALAPVGVAKQMP